MAGLLREPVPCTVCEKTCLVLRHGIALWDVCESCEVDGASDASIRQVRPNDVGWLLRQTGIRKVFCNGSTARKLYDRHILPVCGLPAAALPSTSPANARWTLPLLLEAWQRILTD